MADNPEPQVLALWEAGSEPLAMLAASGAGDPIALAEWPVGVRDAALIGLSRSLYGDALTGTIDCPACAEKAEVELDASAFLSDQTEPHPISIIDGQWSVTARAVNSIDLVALAGVADADAGARILALQVISGCARDGTACAPDDLPDSTMTAIGDALAVMDPLASIELMLDCPHCGHSFPTLFDPADHLADSVAADAQRLLGQVAALARAYGWAERDILAMSAARRAAYLELAA